MSVRVALPTGDWRAHVADMLARAGIDAPGYEPGGRAMRSQNGDETAFRIFRERDIPVQVALGNYDLGICGEVYLEEHQVRFPLEAVRRIGALPGGEQGLWLATAPGSGLDPGVLPARESTNGARIASEFPAIADALAAYARIPGYRLRAIAGSPSAYPPEDAEFVLAPGTDREAIERAGLLPITRIFRGGLALIANARALSAKDLGSTLTSLASLLIEREPERTLPRFPGRGPALRADSRDRSVLRLAIPDGHAQRVTPECLAAAGLVFDGYDRDSRERRPATGIDGLAAKVLRPQDMPELVARGDFDLAITGVDVLTEHLSRFPGSPVRLAVDLGRNQYRIGPVVQEDFPAATTREALSIWLGLGRPVRIASEFPGLAERFARDNQIHHATIIPIRGASEGFVPEDADILIEGVETGSSLRANRLRMLDPFLESTNCLIARTEPLTERRDLLADIVARLAESVSAPKAEAPR